MRVLVIHASANGSTAEIAGEIARRIGLAGVETELVAARDVAAVDGFDAFVIGSAVHGQAWLDEAHDLVHMCAREMGDRPVWLFSVSTVGATSSAFGPRVGRLLYRMRREPKDLADVRTLLRVQGHRSFAGVIERERWGRLGHLFLRALGGSYGDHRDWADIDSWAESVAASIGAMRPVGT